MDKLELAKIRGQIDGLDEQLVQILEARMRLVMEVAAYKKHYSMNVKDVRREEEVIRRAIAKLDDKVYAAALSGIMRSVIDASCELEEGTAQEEGQRSLLIGCYGVAGSFTHQALEEYFAGREYERRHYNMFEELVSAVSDGTLDYGGVPRENSSTGGITDVYDLLRHYNCSIVGERCVKIEQNLLGWGGATLNTVKRVYSHPQGLAQSREFFRDHPQMEQIPYFSTSKSAAMVAEQQDITLAAVAGRQAAELYGLKVLAANINYNSNNFTRFVIIAREPAAIKDADKITLVIAVKHEAGSLYKILGYLYHSGLNMMNLESRPMDGKSWEYFFHIDLTGNLSDPEVRDALEEVAAHCNFCKILGNYRADCRKE